MLPFTHAQFLEVFARYNTGVWPAQLPAYLLGLAMALVLLRRPATAGRWVGLALAAMWLWTGIAYHGIYFSLINKAAYLFATLFAIQGLLLLNASFAGKLQFGGRRDTAGWLGWGLILYALAVYPMLGVLAGQRYPQMPMFGISPCPVTLFTFGVFLLATGHLPRRLLVVPVIWSLVGGSAAFLLEVPQDWPLLFSGLSVLPLLRGRARPALELQQRSASGPTAP